MNFPTDEELFPALFDESKKPKQQGKLRTNYVEFVEDNIGKCIDAKYRKREVKFEAILSSETFKVQEAYNKFNDKQREQEHGLYILADNWLGEKIKKGEVDSLPPLETPLFKQKKTHSFSSLSAEGRRKEALNAAKRDAVNRGMNEYADTLDKRESAVNMALTGTYGTDLDLTNMGKMSGEDWGTSAMYRGMKEDERRHELEKEYAVEALGGSDYKRSTYVSDDTHYLDIRDLGKCYSDIKGAETMYQSYSTLFNLFNPLYLMAHPITTKDSVKRILEYLSPSLVTAALIGIMTLIPSSGFWGVLNAVLSLVLLFCILFSLAFLFAALITIGEFISRLVKKNKCREQAKKNLNEAYRRMRFYALWYGEKSYAVQQLQEIIDDYLKAYPNG